MEELSGETKIDKKRTVVRERVRAWRFTNRKTLDAAREEENYRKSPEGKLARYWQKAFDKLTPEQQADLRAQHERATSLLSAISTTIADISNHRTAGDSMCFPDLLYAEVKVFLVECPPIRNWLDRSTAAHVEPDDLAKCDDPAFRDFGLDTRLPLFLVQEFDRHCLMWCECNPDVADPVVFAELRASVKSDIPPLTPTPPGIRIGMGKQFTKSEEKAAARRREEIAVTQKLMQEQSQRVDPWQQGEGV